MNNWQSIDFRESMNALLSQKLLGQDNHYQLPTIIWQDNTQPQTWKILDTFGGKYNHSLPLGTKEEEIHNQYAPEIFQTYCQSYQKFHADLFEKQAQQIAIDLPLDQDIHLNGRVKLSLRVKSSVSKGLLSAHLLVLGQAKRFTPLPSLLARTSLDNGRYHAQENLMELPFVDTPHRVITKGFLNLQNRTNLLTIETVPKDQWMTIEWELQPTIYQLKKGDTLRLLLYTTDFECTIRDNSDWTITVDLQSSQLIIPS